jgi:hypothetical protein
MTLLFYKIVFTTHVDAKTKLGVAELQRGAANRI